MSRAGLALIALSLLAAACSPSDAAPATTATAEPTTSIPPVTTLPPASTATTSTTLPPTTTTTMPAPIFECDSGSQRLPEGYAHRCVVFGIEILAAEEVDLDAAVEMADRTLNMLLEQPMYSAAIAEYPIGLRVIGVDQTIRDLPEFEEIYFHHPGTDWRRKGRSFPGTELIPYAAGAEENLLCAEDDRYASEDMFIREFAITIRRFAMSVIDEHTSDAIEQAYGVAIAEGKWKNTLSEIDSDQYWAEGVQSFFDSNLEDNEEDREPNSSHNHVDTREELRSYDRALFEIARSVFGDTEWRPSCATARS